MSLYSIFPNLKDFAYIRFDRNEVRAKFGRNIKNHIDVSSIPLSYFASWQPLTVNFSDDCEGMTGSAIPNIMEFKGRLFLSYEAYEMLKPLLENDGEFLSVTYEKGGGYIFNPLSMAEDVGGLNTGLSIKNEWNEVVTMAFHEEKVKGFMVFRSSFDNHRSIICQKSVKEVIEKSGFGGVYFTSDLGNRFVSVGDIAR